VVAYPEAKLSNPSATKNLYDHQGPQGALPTSEAPVKDYPPSMGAITATERSTLPSVFSSLGDARGTVNASTKGTSVDLGSQKVDEDLGDTTSQYTSDVPECLAYVQELATSFLGASELPDTQSLERMHRCLPDLLRGFAQRIGGERHASVNFEAIKFIYRR
jgi:hypothetical protein